MSDAGGKVVGLRGEPIAAPTDPVSEVLWALEQARERADSGDLRSVVVTGICADGSSLRVWGVGRGMHFPTLGALTDTLFELQKKGDPA